MRVLKNNALCFNYTAKEINVDELKNLIRQQLASHSDEYYLVCNGKIINNGSIDCTKTIYMYPRILGGKGGFGSMLRAIGAQIEKTTNREACRDLSGRRLRDINEEQRLKNWINQQAEREKEAKERKKKKLEKLLENPKHEFKDEDYDKERSALPERVEDAVLKGLEASASCSVKRKPETQTAAKKKRKLWVDSELDENLSSSESCSDNEEHSKDDSLKTNGESVSRTEDDQEKSKSEESNVVDKEATDNESAKCSSSSVP